MKMTLGGQSKQSKTCTFGLALIVLHCANILSVLLNKCDVSAGVKTILQGCSLQETIG